MRYVLDAARQILFSIPMAVLWVLMFTVVTLGWGIESAGKFIKHWNNFVEDGSVEFGGAN